jgi:hypothetical protein
MKENGYFCRIMIDCIPPSIRKGLLLALLLCTVTGARAQSGNTFFVRIGDQYVLTDQLGTLLYPEAFDEIHNPTAFSRMDTTAFGDNYSYSETETYIVRKNGRYGVFRALQFLVPCEYDYLEHALSHYPFDLFIATRGGKTGLIDQHGKVVLPLIYNSVSQVQGSDMFRVQQDGKYRLLTVEGGTIRDYLGAAYDRILMENAYFILFEEDNQRLCGFSEVVGSGEYVCLPAKKCVYYAGEEDILQVLPGNKTVASYSFDLRFLGSRGLEANELEESYLPFEDELAPYELNAGAIALDFFKAISDSLGIDIHQPKPPMTQEECNRKIRGKLDYQERVESNPHYLVGYSGSHTLKDTAAVTGKGAIISHRDNRAKVIGRTVIAPVYDTLYFVRDDGNYLIGYKLNGRYGLLDVHGRDLLGPAYDSVASLKGRYGGTTQYIAAYDGKASYIYHYRMDDGSKELLYIGKYDDAYVLAGNTILISGKNAAHPGTMLFVAYITPENGSKTFAGLSKRQMPEYDSLVAHPILAHYFLAYRNGKSGLLAHDGTESVPVIYDSIHFHYLMKPLPFEARLSEYEPQNANSKLTPAISAYCGDSLYYYQRGISASEGYNFYLASQLFTGGRKVTVSSDGMFILVSESDGVRIHRPSGARLSEQLYANVETHSVQVGAFWYIHAEDKNGEPLLIGRNGKEIRLPE